MADGGKLLNTTHNQLFENNFAQFLLKHETFFEVREFEEWLEDKKMQVRKMSLRINSLSRFTVQIKSKII